MRSAPVNVRGNTLESVTVTGPSALAEGRPRQRGVESVNRPAASVINARTRQKRTPLLHSPTFDAHDAGDLDCILGAALRVNCGVPSAKAAECC